MGMICPSCGHDNILGEDRCEQCLHSLMQRDLPRPRKDDPFQSVMMTAPVSELINGKDLLVASEDDTLDKVVKILRDKKLKCVIVYRKKQLVGILSNRDLLRKVAKKGINLSKVLVSEVMTPNPEYVRPEEPVAVAVNKMAMGGFRNVPVISADGAPLSIITIKDVLVYLSHRDEVSGRPAEPAA